MEEALIKRILPHSIEAEQSVIGSMILDRDAILVASEILTSDDFYQKQYGIIFDAMVELCNEGKPVDLVTLQNRLKEKELPPDISSMEYVRDLISAVPTSANVKYYAKIVSEKAVLRRLIKANEEIANTCYLEKENTEIILEEAEKKLFNILQRRNNEEYVPIQQVVLNAINNIEKASKLKGSVTGIPTGFMDLDYKTSDRSPSFHGENSLCTEHCTVYGIPKGCHSCHIQSGNVKGTAGEPTSGNGISCRFPEYENR
jgi:replicative DNA helicase